MLDPRKISVNLVGTDHKVEAAPVALNFMVTREDAMSVFRLSQVLRQGSPHRPRSPLRSRTGQRANTDRLRRRPVRRAYRSGASASAGERLPCASATSSPG